MVRHLNTIDTQGNKYIAKLKDNQLKLKEKAIETMEMSQSVSDTYEEEAQYLSENKKRVTRKVELFTSKSSKQIMYHDKFNNIQSLIKVTKTVKDFHDKILQHWRVETYHYHLDMLMDEDDHIAYKEPFSILILRSFAINLYQLFLNANKDKKVLPTGKTTMAEIKRNCRHRDDFTAELFEQEPLI